VDSAGIRALPTGENEPDFDLLTRYVRLVESGPDSNIGFSRIDQRGMRIRTHLEAGQLVLVQETYDPAWRARSGSRLVPVSKDMMGFLLIDPGPGDHDILLQFETPLENLIGRVFFVAGAAMVTWLLVKGFDRSKT
jgi:hypothetical protein